MLDRQSKTIEMIQSMVHGKPTGNRQKQPSMFQLLSMTYSPSKSACQFVHHQKNPQFNQFENQENLYLEEYGSQVEQSKIQGSLEQENKKEVFQNYNSSTIYKKTMKPHYVHEQQIYMYDNIRLKKQKQEEFDNIKHKTQPQEQMKKKLDSNNIEDRKIISQRKKKIKEFQKVSRDLPNSAFTTYFGKPAFQAYGRCNSQKLKTHNVMPHKGSNHPKNNQSYKSALIHGLKLGKNKDSFIPRKPLQDLKQRQNNKDEEKIINLPMQKPDLINHIRFAKSESKPQKKQKIPLKQSMKKMKKSNSVKLSKSFTLAQKKNKRKLQKTKNNFNDGLKYMNIRDNLLQIFERRKIKASKLAYKVTECYPLRLQKHFDSQKIEYLQQLRPKQIIQG